ncbi:MAG: GNAT family N-acetyltransferase [Erysipelotrichaceae bacterium]|nr:GNAT family N-acetyltransferase [Erysipelotrichaceae bacterium]
MEFRFLKENDQDVLIRLTETFRHQQISREKASDILSNRKILVAAALQEQEVAGYTLAYLLPRLDNGRDMMMIYHLFVQEQFQRQGIATRLMEMLLEYSKEYEIHYTCLITQQDNEKAIALYKKLGGTIHPTNNTVFYWYGSGQPQI